MSATATVTQSRIKSIVSDQTMKAIVQDRYGSADVLQLREIDKPVAAAGEVLVRVRAAGIHQGDWHVMAGLPYFIRLGFGLRRPKTRVRGMDVSGVVEEVGPGVTRLKVGDEVFGWCNGSLADYAAVRENNLLTKPARLTMEQAAAVAESGMAALQAVRDSGRVQAGQRVLVIGAGGGVGSFAVQIAKASGADVTGVCSTAKMDLVRSIGADRVIDYTREDFTRSGQRYDVVIDTGGRRPLRHLRRALAPAGTLVLVGGEGGERWLGGFGRQLRAPLVSVFIRQQLRMLVSMERNEDLAALKELIDAGKVTPAIDRTYPLSQAADAMRHLAAGQSRGKTVVTVSGDPR
jgi:NADPH:quinone reductase-like Zn-dependent oxidoreductase